MNIYIYFFYLIIEQGRGWGLHTTSDIAPLQYKSEPAEQLPELALENILVSRKNKLILVSQIKLEVGDNVLDWEERF